MTSIDLTIPLRLPVSLVLHRCILKVSGDGYNGKYRFVNTPQGWCLKGEGGDYLTVAPGLPNYFPEPIVLLELLLASRSNLVVKASM